MPDQTAEIPATRRPAPQDARPANGVSTVRVLTATLAAAVANLAVFAIATANGVSFDVAAPQPPNAVAIAMITVIPLAVGAFVVELVTRHQPGFQLFAAWAGLAFALVTCGGSFGASDTLATALSLSVMHLVVGAAWLYAIKPRAHS